MSDENKLRKFKLINREGFINSHHTNQVHLESNLADGCFTGYFDEDGDVRSERGMLIIECSELEFFEEVVEETTPVYWDGKNTDDIEVGLVVNFHGNETTVKLVHCGEFAVVDECGMYVADSEELSSALPTEKEQAFTKFIDAWRKQGLDFAFDDGNDSCELDLAFNVFYETFLEEK